MIRWIPFIFIVAVTMLIQTSAWRVLTVTIGAGSIAPDLAVIVALFVAFNARSSTDAMLAGWVIGLGIDLTTGGGPGVITVVGPMSIALAVVGGIVCRIREVLFRDSALTQFLVTLPACAAAHFLWGTIQTLRLGELSWDEYKAMLLQILLVAVYTAILAPTVFYVLGKFQRLIFLNVSGRGR